MDELTAPETEEDEREVAIPLLLLVDFTEVPVPVGPVEYVALETG